MTLQRLANKENELCNKVEDLYRQHQSEPTKEELRGIFAEYRKIHHAYAELSLTDDEALKRGLFIQWYALLEPNYLTGIADLDENAKEKIVQALHGRFESGSLDDELIWMLNYYSSWEWIFKRLISFGDSIEAVLNARNNRMPDKVDRNEMALRGQMGKYWNSLTVFSDL